MPPRVTSTGGVVNLVSVGDKSIMAQKLDPAFVKAQFELSGYQALSEYISSKEKISFICPKGHRGAMPWKTFERGSRCQECSGNKTLDHRFVESALEAEGYQMLSKYVNSKQNISYICPKGHKGFMSWGSFNSGHRCLECSGHKKLDHEFVKSAFEVEGYQVLSEYTKFSDHISFICPKGHKGSMPWITFRKGSRCLECSGKKKLDHEFVKSVFMNEGYEVLSEYVNSKKNIYFMCPKGHKGEIAWNTFRNGGRCLECSGRKKLNHEFVSAEYKKAGYILLSTYISSGTKNKVLCPNGHEIVSTWDHFKQGHGCAKCLNLAKKSQEEIVKAFEIEGYKVISDYINSITPVKFICPKGHSHCISWGSFRQGHRCGKCNADSLYGCFEYAYFGRITRSINNSIKSQNIFNKTWRDFYDVNTIKEIEFKIRFFYKLKPADSHVDHIVPTSWFDLTNQEELEACWDIGNLRFLPNIDNIVRGNKMSKDEIEFMKKKHPKIINIASRAKC